MRSLTPQHLQCAGKQPCSRIFQRGMTPNPVHCLKPAAKGSNTGSAVPGTSQPHQQQQQRQDSRHRQQPLVRPINMFDKPAWMSLFKDYIEWYKASVPEDVVELTWQRMLAGGEGSHQALVAEDSNGQLVGLAHILLHRSTWSATHYCYLEDLYVHHEVRGGGVGKALIEAVYAIADQQGSTKVYWQTHEMNYRARGLYDKLGRKSAFILYERT